ncbi:MAG: RagB/SusD family nutrient uptake outer membrane protein [Muribaculaceae bacterium]|nr:RagB/SusD family nutrient uptake outer membrane protein [Muribaculaceae bacterium]
MKLLNIFTIGAVAVGMTLTSCAGSFLDVESKTESNVDNFYSTQNDALRALIGCYDGWRQVSSNPGIGFYVSSTVMSDETFGATGNGDGYGYQAIDGFDLAKSPSDVNLYETDWSDYYAGIYRCNMLIQNEEKIAWDSAADKGRIMGECRALRAILYFDLVRWFGNIPLLRVPTTELLEQADPAEVYALIFEDLQYAINNIPADAYHGNNPDSAVISGTWGRITKQTAEGIFARAYLYYTGYYGQQPGWTDEEGNIIGNVTKAEALDALEDVIASGYYKLVEDYKTLWVAASVVPIAGESGWNTELSTFVGDENSEVMLSQNFTPTQDYNGNNDSNRWLVMLGMRNYNANAFNLPYGKGWGACTVCPTFYNNYLNGDPRAYASVIDLSAEGIATGSDWEAAVNDWREYTGLTVKKYTPMVYGNGNPATNPDGTAGFQECNPTPWVILRYADILLMAAELGSNNAQSYFDQVRARVGLSPVALTQENIMNERRVEFAMEGIRYWDLMRQANGGEVTALADAIMASNGQTVLNGGLESAVTYDRDKIIKTKGLSQIPQNQITLSNDVLKQNQGW